MDKLIKINSNIVFYRNCDTPIQDCPVMQAAREMLPKFDSWQIRSNAGSFVLSVNAADMNFQAYKVKVAAICAKCRLSKDARVKEKVKQQDRLGPINIGWQFGGKVRD